MKIRQDFVTNSSSSSFICSFCEEETEGYDYFSADCQNEYHCFCEECASVENQNLWDALLTDEERRIYILQKYNSVPVKEILTAEEKEQFKDILLKAKNNEIIDKEEFNDYFTKLSDIVYQYDCTLIFCAYCDFIFLDKENPKVIEDLFIKYVPKENRTELLLQIYKENNTLSNNIFLDTLIKLANINVNEYLLELRHSGVNYCEYYNATVPDLWKKYLS